VLAGRQPFFVLRQRKPPKKKGKRRAAAGAAAAASAGPETWDEALFERLRSLRRRIADELGVPPYIVFSDRSLREMSAAKPRTPDQLLRISGVGDRKLAQYGDRFLAAIAKHLGSQ
jgi:ATP-dependent DNA helicase RecQ